MDILVKGVDSFLSVFYKGGEVFVSWVTGIIPMVLLLLVAMNTIVRLIGEDKINNFAMKSTKNPIIRYMILPFVGAFMLGNPMSLTLGRFMPEFYKPGYCATSMFFCHTSNGIFPHINPGELFVYTFIADGVTKLGLNPAELAIRYLLVGLIANFMSGYATDFITEWVSKQQGVTLSKVAKNSI